MWRAAKTIVARRAPSAPASLIARCGITAARTMRSTAEMAVVLWRRQRLASSTTRAMAIVGFFVRIAIAPRTARIGEHVVQTIRPIALVGHRDRVRASAIATRPIAGALRIATCWESVAVTTSRSV